MRYPLLWELQRRDSEGCCRHSHASTVRVQFFFSEPICFIFFSKLFSMLLEHTKRFKMKIFCHWDDTLVGWFCITFDVCYFIQLSYCKNNNHLSVMTLEMFCRFCMLIVAHSVQFCIKIWEFLEFPQCSVKYISSSNLFFVTMCRV